MITLAAIILYWFLLSLGFVLTIVCVWAVGVLAIWINDQIQYWSRDERPLY